MHVLKRTLLVVAALAVVVGGWVSATLPPHALRPTPLPDDAGALVAVRGVYHVHSKASDGTGSFEEIAAAAARAGLRFVILTDHGDAFRDPAQPRYIGSVLVIDANEISTTDGHYVALGSGRPPYPLAGEGRDVIEDVRRFIGFGIVAHPDSPRDTLRWNEWSVPADGFEWLNADSSLRELPARQWLPTLLRYLVRPAPTLAAGLSRPRAALAAWDRLTQQHPLVALAASDAHARFGLRRRPEPYDDNLYLKVPDYAPVFGTFSLNVETGQAFTGKPDEDARTLIAAIQAGSVYTSVDGLAAGGRLSFSATSGTLSAREGATLPIDRAVMVRAQANIPTGGSLVLFRNGTMVEEVRGATLRHATDRPGAYRVEAWLPHADGVEPMPWLLSNPIYIGMPPAPAAPTPEPVGLALSPFPEASEWHVEADASSTGSEKTVTVPASGRPVHELTFELGRGAASPFSALGTRTVASLKSAAGIGVSISASRPLRVSVQVRLDSGESNLRWVRSVYAGSAPRTVWIPFADMREAGTGARTSFSASRIQALLFVVDTVNARPGDRGVIRIGELQVGVLRPDRQQ